MGEKLLINVAVEETRVALVESGRIKNLEIDTALLDQAKGNIYKAIVHRVNPSLQAAFVDYGAEKQGFLPVSEIHDRYVPKEHRGKRAPIQDILKNGQELMVQVVKDEIGNKGASLSTYISLPGRYLVLMAQSDKTGISRRLPGDERKRLKEIIDKLPVPDGFGVIIRTAGVERDGEELGRDLDYLKRLWAGLEDRFKELRDPGLIHRERSIALRFIRDYATAQLDEIIVDDTDAAEEIRDFCTILIPELRQRVVHYQDATPLYSRYQLEDQIDDIFARRIDLPSGGYILIDQTEALVSIDVNSGRVKTDDIEKTALKTNLEAAAEIARQLKIRDLGGLVVIDFIDMRERDNTRSVENAAKEAFANDKAKVKFTRISDFGLMEVSRQRLKSSITKGSFHDCDHCGGTGKLRSVESSAMYILRRLKEQLVRGSYLHAKAKVPVPIANYLANRKRRDLIELEMQTQTTIEVDGTGDCPPMKAFVELLTQPSKGKRPRRMLQTFDLVRSDVDKREIGEDDDFLLEAAEARGVNLSDEDFDNLYRKIEKEMAREAEATLEEKEAAVQVATKRADEAEKKAERAELEAEEIAARLAILKSIERQPPPSLGLFGWIKRFFVGSPAPEVPKALALPTPDEAPSERRERAPARSPASERIRAKNQGPRGRPKTGPEDADDDDGNGNKGDGRSRRRRRSHTRPPEQKSAPSMVETGDRRKKDANKSSDGSDDSSGGGGGRKRRRRRRRRRRSGGGDSNASDSQQQQSQKGGGGGDEGKRSGDDGGDGKGDDGNKRSSSRRRSGRRGGSGRSDDKGGDDAKGGDDKKSQSKGDGGDDKRSSQGRSRRSGGDDGPKKSDDGGKTPSKGGDDGPKRSGGDDKKSGGDKKPGGDDKKRPSGNGKASKGGAPAPATSEAPKMPKRGGVIDLRGGTGASSRPSAAARPDSGSKE